jgi:hypothetical protein
MLIYSVKVQPNVTFFTNTITNTIFIRPLYNYDVQFSNSLIENDIKFNIYSIHQTQGF